ncbi:MAG: hypothetical protein H6567_07630 [Lewinellaceae bacterium]|nr:hypothetical protein [Lewinellaceae bacterium]
MQQTYQQPKYFAYLLILLFCGYAGGTTIGQNPYADCCGTEPKEYSFEDFHVYIPNIITPNGDGINDAFYPICNAMQNNRFTVANMFIYDSADALIFFRPGLDVEDPENYGFTGHAYKKPVRFAFPFEHTGLFRYTLELVFRRADGKVEFIPVEGTGCVVRCDDDAAIIKDKQGCYFPVQGAGGIFHPNQSNNETTCFD